MRTKIKIVAVLLGVIILVSACGESPVYLDGAETATYLLGEIQPLPSKPELRSIGEEMCKKILTFNYIDDIPEKINILNKELSEYNVLKGSDVGSAEILESRNVDDGMVFVHYPSDVNGIYNLVSGKWNSWIMPDYPPFSPPPPTSGDIKALRPFTPEVAEIIAKKFLLKIGIMPDDFFVRVTFSETKVFADVFFIEKLADKKIDSPNWVKVKVNFWGMVKEFTKNLGSAPKITTKPTVDEKDAIKIAREELNISDKIKIPEPERVIKRVRYTEDNQVFLIDELGWFFDFLSVEAIKKGTLLISAHTGKVME